jgi:hypothetical protein
LVLELGLLFEEVEEEKAQPEEKNKYEKEDKGKQSFLLEVAEESST